MTESTIKSILTFPIKVWNDDVNKDNYVNYSKEAVSFLIITSITISLSFFSHLFLNQNIYIHYISIAILFVSFVSIPLGIGRLLYQIRKIDFNKHISCSTIISCESSLKKLFLDSRYEDMEKYIKKTISNHGDYQSFITFFEEATRKERHYLSVIHDDAKASIGGRYLCVLSNPKYYIERNNDLEMPKQTESLITYFISFDALTKKNQFIRVFSLPIKDGKTTFTQGQVMTFLQYILINYLIGIETYILTYVETDNYDFFKRMDYVVGENFTNTKATTLYFSYEKTGVKGDYVICSRDNYLINIMHSDFFSRLKYSDRRDGSECVCLKITEQDRQDYKKILRLLNIYDDKNKEITKDFEKRIIQDLIDCVSQERICPEELSKKLNKDLKKWIENKPEKNKNGIHA